VQRDNQNPGATMSENEPSGSSVCDVRDGASDTQQRAQQAQPATSLKNDEIEAEDARQNSAGSVEHDSHVDLASRDIYNTPHVLTDAGSGMQVDSAVS
jgi:hypothetical protein